MKRHLIARKLPEEIWAAFEPVLPPAVWCGEGRPPASNHACLHGLLDVLITGIGGEYVPPRFPCGKTLKGRLRPWLEHDRFRAVWAEPARRHESLEGVHGDKAPIDGSKKPAEKGAPTPAPAPWTVPSAAPQSPVS